MLTHEEMRAKVRTEINKLNKDIRRYKRTGFTGLAASCRSVVWYLKWVLQDVLKP